ncbi:MAG: hypothetical protein AAFY59_20155 [Pseudomonadota bacterium]
MLKMITVTAAALAIAAPLSAGEWTATGPNGGFGSGTYSCSQSDGVRSCSSQGRWTGPNGNTRDRTTERTITRDSVTGERVVTGANGRERTFTWRRDRHRN